MDEKNLINITEDNFESIKHIDENGIEYWYARELKNVLNYKEWRKFENVINKAKEACENSDISIFDHSRQEYEQLSEDEKRLYTRKNVKDKNKYLFDTAKLAGVKNYGKFNNYGYRGLYNGETAKDIANRKGISEKEDILDYMSSTELAANLFRITQTDEVLKNKNINNEDDACKTHHNVGQAVRQTIKRIGGTMPEDLPTPSKSAKQIEKEKNKELKSNDKKRLK